MRVALVLVASCYTGAPSASPPPTDPPPAQHEMHAPRGGPRCPSQSQLQLDGGTDSAACLNKETGKKDGPRMVFYPDGAVALEEHWQDGVPHGTWRAYYANGRVSHERKFVDAKEASHAAFDDHGAPRALPPLADNRCASDADCTIGFAGPDCCVPDAFCGEFVAKARMKSVEDRCFGVYCGRPVPSSSCMGMMGVKPRCVNGTCGR